IDRDVVADRLRRIHAALAEPATEPARPCLVQEVVGHLANRPELPAEHRAVERLRPLDVIGWELDVVELAVLRHSGPPVHSGAPGPPSERRMDQAGFDSAVPPT